LWWDRHGPVTEHCSVVVNTVKAVSIVLVYIFFYNYCSYKQCAVISDVLSLKVLFYYVILLEFMVLTYSIPRKIIAGEKDS